jgi:hypothetical protein
MKTIKKERTIAHPLEEAFDIEEGTTLIEYTEVIPEKLVEVPSYDSKDDEIEQKLEEVYISAMGTVATVADALETAESKHKARIGEVTAAMLMVALGAIREKRELKKHKDVHVGKASVGNMPHTVNNNLIVTDRNEILRLIANNSKT